MWKALPVILALSLCALVRADCPGDANQDGVTDVQDLLAVLGGWGTCPLPADCACPTDLNCDGATDVQDLLIVLGDWGCIMPHSEGPNSAGTGASAAPGDVAWTNPSNITASDDAYATAATLGTTTEYLRASNFGFAIPSDATITKVAVSIEGKSTSSSIIVDAFLVVSGSQAGTDQSSNDALTGTEGTVTYDPGTNWGATLTPAIVNASDFGFELRVYSFASVTTSIDHITITVYYTGANPPARDGWTPGPRRGQFTSQSRIGHFTPEDRRGHHTARDRRGQFTPEPRRGQFTLPGRP